LAREACSLPIVVNGDIRNANDAKRALDVTGAAAVMIGRRAMQHPWIFREARARLDQRSKVAPPTLGERFALCREQLHALLADRGERRAVRAMRRCYAGYLQGVPYAQEIVAELCAADEVSAVLDALARGEEDASAAMRAAPPIAVNE
jgi:tRNA-dihydrouridine synthase